MPHRSNEPYNELPLLPPLSSVPVLLPTSVLVVGALALVLALVLAGVRLEAPLVSASAVAVAAAPAHPVMVRRMRTEACLRMSRSYHPRA